MKTLFFLHLSGPIHGSNVVGNMLRNSEIISIKFNPCFIDLNSSKKSTDIGRFGLVKVILVLKLYLQTIYFLRKRYDLIYIAPSVNGIGFLRDFVLILIIKLLTKTKIVLHLHNRGIEENTKFWIYRFAYSIAFRDCSVIGLSNLLVSDFRSFFTEKNTYICNNGILGYGKGKEIQNEGVLTLLFLGNLMKEKGVLRVVELCSNLRCLEIDFCCNIVGAPLDVSIEDLNFECERLGVRDCVSVIGPVYGVDKTDYLEKADIFIFPSTIDCFPLVLLEALQFSIPVISSNFGGIPDIVKDGENGFVVDPMDISAMTKIVQLLNEDRNLLLSLKLGAYSSFKNNFSYEVFMRNIVSILTEITEESSEC